jgi:hypothetical protein
MSVTVAAGTCTANYNFLHCLSQPSVDVAILPMHALYYAAVVATGLQMALLYVVDY